MFKIRNVKIRKRGEENKNRRKKFCQNVCGIKKESLFLRSLFED